MTEPVDLGIRTNGTVEIGPCICIPGALGGRHREPRSDNGGEDSGEREERPTPQM